MVRNPQRYKILFIPGPVFVRRIENQKTTNVDREWLELYSILFSGDMYPSYYWLLRTFLAVWQSSDWELGRALVRNLLVWLLLCRPRVWPKSLIEAKVTSVARHLAQRCYLSPNFWNWLKVPFFFFGGSAWLKSLLEYRDLRLMRLVGSAGYDTDQIRFV